ncbi:arylacetamide deacetylase-like isoform X3 [Ostrea edulis]|uniref:arylacetamide deacetylase-like isoform X3 n=1 Tax=Ostrea edulis TaxID=37623 RepID=UPI0024AF4C87|nr:arylacetamide deacetylase-like isoform X3 [Ostrea edulis]
MDSSIIERKRSLSAFWRQYDGFLRFRQTMGAVVFGSGIVIALSLVGTGYTSVGILSMVAVALVSLADYLYVPMPAIADEKVQRQKILAKLRLGNLWTEDMELDGVTVRIYQPADLQGEEKLPGVVYFHGGGFCWESFGLYDIMIKTMLKLKRMVVVYVRYRLAPEFPFPAAVDDCFTVTRYVQKNTKQFKMDPQRLALMGDSAGGNLTMNMLIRMITEAVPDLPKFKVQIAIYPYIQALDFKTPSYQIYDNNKTPTLLNADLMIKFLVTYALGFATFDESEIRKLLENKHWTTELRNSNLPKLVHNDVLPENLERPNIKMPVSKSIDSSLARKFNDIFLDPRFSPLLADDEILGKMPKTYVMSTELDCIRDDAFFLTDRLRKLGVDVTHRHWGGMDHAFLVFSTYESSLKALQEITNYLNDNL